jgi:carbonic anhydrase/acetyltransferase-like protein (isoleucine patch superfamily)
MGKITIGKNTVIEDNCVIHSGSPKVPWIQDVVSGITSFRTRAISNGTKIGN